MPLHDEAFLVELELTTAMIIAASEADGVMLRQDEIDQLLGVTPPA